MLGYTKKNWTHWSSASSSHAGPAKVGKGGREVRAAVHSWKATGVELSQRCFISLKRQKAGWELNYNFHYYVIQTCFFSLISLRLDFRVSLCTLSRTTSLMAGRPSGLFILAEMNWNPRRNSRSYFFFSSVFIGIHCSETNRKQKMSSC